MRHQMSSLEQLLSIEITVIKNINSINETADDKAEQENMLGNDLPEKLH